MAIATGTSFVFRIRVSRAESSLSLRAGRGLQVAAHAPSHAHADVEKPWFPTVRRGGTGHMSPTARVEQNGRRCFAPRLQDTEKANQVMASRLS